MAVGATFRRSGHPALLLRKLTRTHAIVYSAVPFVLVAVPGKEWCWPAKPLTTRRRHGDIKGFNKYDWKVGDRVRRKGAVKVGAEMVGEVLKVTPTMHHHLMSDGVSRAHVRVRWSNGYVAIVPEGGLVPADPARSADSSRSVSAYRGWDRRREHNEAVMVNLDPDLLPLWDRVHTVLQGTPAQRLRAFEEYVHDHPGEAWEALQASADAKLEAMFAARPRRKAG